MLLTAAAPPSNWVSAQTPSQKECLDDVWGVKDGVLTSDWPFAQNDIRDVIEGVTLSNSGTWA